MWAFQSIWLFNAVMCGLERVQGRVSDVTKDVADKTWEKKRNYFSLRKVKTERDSLCGSVSQGEMQRCCSAEPRAHSLPDLFFPLVTYLDGRCGQPLWPGVHFLYGFENYVLKWGGRGMSYGDSFGSSKLAFFITKTLMVLKFCWGGIH